MADKVARRENELARSIRETADIAGGPEKLRKLCKLSNGTFYGLLKGSRSQRNPTKTTLQKLADAGVRIPDWFRSAA